MKDYHFIPKAIEVKKIVFKPRDEVAVQLRNLGVYERFVFNLLSSDERPPIDQLDQARNVDALLLLCNYRFWPEGEDYWLHVRQGVIPPYLDEHEHMRFNANVVVQTSTTIRGIKHTETSALSELDENGCLDVTIFTLFMKLGKEKTQEAINAALRKAEDFQSTVDDIVRKNVNPPLL